MSGTFTRREKRPFNVSVKAVRKILAFEVQSMGSKSNNLFRFVHSPKYHGTAARQRMALC